MCRGNAGESRDEKDSDNSRSRAGRDNDGFRGD